MANIEEKVSDKIIKNPNRKVDKDYDMDSFLPEYIKLGITPTSAPGTETKVASILEMPEKDLTMDDTDDTTLSAGVPKIGDYILMLDDKVVLYGNLSDVLEKAKSIMYDEDTEYSLFGRSIDDLIVLKRMNLKYGVFIEQ